MTRFLAHVHRYKCRVTSLQSVESLQIYTSITKTRILTLLFLKTMVKLPLSEMGLRFYPKALGIKAAIYSLNSLCPGKYRTYGVLQHAQLLDGNYT